MPRTEWARSQWLVATCSQGRRHRFVLLRTRRGLRDDAVQELGVWSQLGQEELGNEEKAKLRRAFGRESGEAGVKNVWEGRR